MPYRFKYVGDPNDDFSGPKVATHFGRQFVKDEPVELEDSEEETANRLANHSHFVDMSDKEYTKAVDEKQKALEKRDADRAKAEEERRKQEEKDEAERAKNLAKAAGQVSNAATAPRPPGKVTREPVQDAFGGRTVEERTPVEDHTKAGKTKD